MELNKDVIRYMHDIRFKLEGSDLIIGSCIKFHALNVYYEFVSIFLCCNSIFFGVGTWESNGKTLRSP